MANWSLVGNGNPCFMMHDLCRVSEGKGERLGGLASGSKLYRHS